LSGSDGLPSCHDDEGDDHSEVDDGTGINPVFDDAVLTQYEDNSQDAHSGSIHSIDNLSDYQDRSHAKNRKDERDTNTHSGTKSNKRKGDDSDLEVDNTDSEQEPTLSPRVLSRESNSINSSVKHCDTLPNLCSVLTNTSPTEASNIGRSTLPPRKKAKKRKDIDYSKRSNFTLNNKDL
jgi:hypothetical protein